MSKKILIDGVFPGHYRVALINAQNKVEDLEYESPNIEQIKGNIYLAKIVRVEPGLQAAFVDFGGIKNGFLPFSEIHPDYYNIPVNDRKIGDMKGLQPLTPVNVELDDAHDLKPVVVEHDVVQDLDITQIEKILDQEKENEVINYEDKAEENIEPIPLYKQYKIQEVIKKGQIVLVQAQKEERGNKGASFTTYISIAGRYCVLMPNNPGHSGVSKRISNQEERKRLKSLISKFLSDNDSKFASVILRTAGLGKSAMDIKRDYEFLAQLWNKIRENIINSKAPSFIHIEEAIIQKTIRDLYDSSVSEIIVDGNEAYASAEEFMHRILPHESSKLKFHNSLVPIFAHYKVESQVAELYQQIVYLPSGGYIVINPTEALTSIDINSGRSTSEKNIEETALKTNVEAAKEIARQFKLRDISGLIVIDFIDMLESRNRKIVERSIKEFTKKDKAKIQIGSISSFGLLEMSRQRLRPSFLELHTKMCVHCNGKGIIRDEEANSNVILRTIENEINDHSADIANIYAHQNIVLYILNHKRLEVIGIEERYGVKLNFIIDSNATSDGFSMEKVTLPTDHNSYAIASKDRNYSAEKNSTHEDVKKPQIEKKEKAGSKRKKWKEGKQNQNSEKEPDVNQAVSVQRDNHEIESQENVALTVDDDVKRATSAKKRSRRLPKTKKKNAENKSESDTVIDETL